MRILWLILAAVSAVRSPAAEFPEAQISNGPVTAKVYLPDAQKAYYRGTRFDWSGQIGDLRVGNRQYFGQWFDKYDPKLHDSIMGPVEEFLTGDSSLGYDEAPVGGTFVRIGVGSVRKPDDTKYQRFKTYDIVDPGLWTVRPGKDRVEFIHELTNEAGYAYRYRKLVRLEKSGMVIEHELKNTGKKPISTMQYNHNFFVTGEPTGPDTSVRFPFALKPTQPFKSEYAELRDGKLVYTSELPKGRASVFSEFEGFGSTSKDYDVRVENRESWSGCADSGRSADPKADLLVDPQHRMPGSLRQPWSVEPGKEQKWTYRYTLSLAPSDRAVSIRLDLGNHGGTRDVVDPVDGGRRPAGSGTPAGAPRPVVPAILAAGGQ